MIEVAWTMLAVFGCFYSALNLRDAQQDRRAVRVTGGSEVQRLVARRNARKQALRLFIFVIFFLIGLAALATPPPVTRHISHLSLVVTVGFVAVAVALLANTYLDLRSRRDLWRLLDRRQADDGPPEGVEERRQ